MNGKPTPSLSSASNALIKPPFYDELMADGLNPEWFGRKAKPGTEEFVTTITGKRIAKRLAEEFKPRVSEIKDLTGEKIRKHSGDRKLALLAQCGVFLNSKFSPASVKELSSFWGIDHTTATTGIKKIDQLHTIDSKKLSPLESAAVKIVPKLLAEGEDLLKRHAEITGGKTAAAPTEAPSLPKPASRPTGDDFIA